MRHDMAVVLGHKPALSVSLQRLLEDPAAKTRFIDDYRDWFGSMEWLAHDLCFLDITRFDIGRWADSEERKAWTLLLASDDAVKARHRTLLTDMFRSGLSTTAHAVFQNGLPEFCRRERGTLEVPRTGAELTRLLNDTGCEIVSEGYASTLFDAPPGRLDDSGVEVAVGSDGPLSPRLSYDDFPTYAGTDRSGLFAQVSEQPFDEIWNASMRFYLEAREALRSRNGKPLSVFVGAPIGVRSENNPARFLRVADVYFGLSGNATDENQRERLKNKALRFLRIVTAQLYRANMSAIAHSLGVMESASAFGHEIKNISLGVAGRWMPAAGKLFEVTIADRKDIPFDAARPVGRSPSELVGKIYLDSEFKWLDQEMGVLPLRQLLIDSGRLIRTWCMLDKPTDFADIAQGATSLQTIIEGCIRRAWSHMMPHLLNQSSLETRAHLQKTKQLYDTFEWLFTQQQRPITYQHGAGCLPIQWNGYLTWLARTLTAALKGCVQHGDPFLPVNVLVSCNNVQSTYTLEIRNSKRRRNETLLKLILERMEQEADQARRKKMEEVATEVLDLLGAAEAGADTLTHHFRTKDVLVFCLSRLGGTLDEFSRADTDPHVVRFTCPIPTKELDDESDRPR